MSPRRQVFILILGWMAWFEALFGFQMAQRQGFPAKGETLAQALRSVLELFSCLSPGTWVGLLLAGVPLCMATVRVARVARALAWFPLAGAGAALFVLIRSWKLLHIEADPAGEFLVLYYLASAIWLGAVAWGHQQRDRLGSRAVTAGIFLGAAGLRLAAWSTPILMETDLHRYLWDGFTLSRGFNPYQFSPEEVLNARKKDQAYLYNEADYRTLVGLAYASTDPAIQGSLERINHKPIPTCYPPIAEMSFALVAKFFPGNLWAWKALTALVDLAVCGLIWLILLRLKLPTSWLLIYAWSPLVLKEYSNTGHFDPIASFFVVLALYFLLHGRQFLAGLGLGLGVATKIYPLVLVPVLLPRLGLIGLTAVPIPVFLSLAPFFGIGLHVFDGFATFAKEWEFNSSLFLLAQELVKALNLPVVRLSGYFKLSPEEGDQVLADYLHELVLDDFLIAKFLVVGLMGLVVLVLARWPEDSPSSWVARTQGCLAALFLLSPVSDPWYFPWILPFVALAPSRSMLYLAASIGTYYGYFMTWKFQAWHYPLQYGPFYLLLFYELGCYLKRHPSLVVPERGPEGPSFRPAG